MKSLNLFDQKTFDNTVVQNPNEHVNARKFSTSINDKSLIINLMEVAENLHYINPALFSSNPLHFKGESYYLFTNGYYGFANKSTDYGFKEEETPYHLDTIFVPFQEIDIEPDKYIELHFNWDTIAKQDAINRSVKENLSYTMEITNTLFCGFNPHYLLDCIQYFKSMIGYVTKDGFNKDGMLNTPVFFQNKPEGKIGILMPYKVTKEDVEKNKN